jgi:hypothetical protein
MEVQAAEAWPPIEVTPKARKRTFLATIIVCFGDDGNVKE